MCQGEVPMVWKENINMSDLEELRKAMDVNVLETERLSWEYLTYICNTLMTRGRGVVDSLECGDPVWFKRLGGALPDWLGPNVQLFCHWFEVVLRLLKLVVKHFKKRRDWNSSKLTNNLAWSGWRRQEGLSLNWIMIMVCDEQRVEVFVCWRRKNGPTSRLGSMHQCRQR